MYKQAKQLSSGEVVSGHYNGKQICSLYKAKRSNPNTVVKFSVTTFDFGQRVKFCLWNGISWLVGLGVGCVLQEVYQLIWYQIVCSVKLYAVLLDFKMQHFPASRSNRFGYVRFKIVCGIKLSAVSNCLQYQNVCGVKFSALHYSVLGICACTLLNCVWCQSVLSETLMSNFCGPL